MKRKRLEQVSHLAWVLAGASIIVGGTLIPSPTLAILLIVVGSAICFGECVSALRAKQRGRRRKKKWLAWLTYLGTLVCAAAFFGVAWTVAELWWVQLIWVATGVALCVPPPDLAKR